MTYQRNETPEPLASDIAAGSGNAIFAMGRLVEFMADKATESEWKKCAAHIATVCRFLETIVPIGADDPDDKEAA